MRIHRTFNDEFPLVWILCLVLVSCWLVSCTSAADRQREARAQAYRMKAMAEDWAWNGIPPPPGMYSMPYSYPPPASVPPVYQQPRTRTTCMQFGTLGQGGQLNCY